MRSCSAAGGVPRSSSAGHATTCPGAWMWKDRTVAVPINSPRMRQLGQAQRTRALRAERTGGGHHGLLGCGRDEPQRVRGELDGQLAGHRPLVVIAAIVVDQAADVVDQHRQRREGRRAGQRIEQTADGYGGHAASPGPPRGFGRPCGPAGCSADSASPSTVTRSSRWPDTP